MIKTHATLPDGRAVVLTWDGENGCIDARLLMPTGDPCAWEASGERGESMDLMCVIGSREECEEWADAVRPADADLSFAPEGAWLEIDYPEEVSPHAYVVRLASGASIGSGRTQEAALGRAREYCAKLGSYPTVTAITSGSEPLLRMEGVVYNGKPLLMNLTTALAFAQALESETRRLAIETAFAPSKVAR